MGLADFVKNSFNSSMSILSGEDITYLTQTKKGVVDDIGNELSIGMGGEANQRGLRISFAGNPFSTLPRSRKNITCRGVTWQITSVDYSPASLVIDVIEPERKR